ncbi:MAG TPA: toll/interleukin-1 receptor domain-containing protein [Pyrinomonadaceae bacterium]
MANPEHLKILEQGVKVWNNWRKEHREILVPQLVGADLNGVDLNGAYLRAACLDSAYLNDVVLKDADLNGASLRDARLRDADLRDADLRDADLRRADFKGADLRRADLNGAYLRDAYLRCADLNGAYLRDAYLIRADFSDADLRGVDLRRANLSDTDLRFAGLNRSIVNGADFTSSRMGNTTLAEIDLSEAKGLETVRHYFPSTVGIDTLYKSAGKIPEAFLRGCGVPDDFITFIPSHFGIQQAINFYSCFISYSHKDEDFAHRLYSRMRDAKLRVWYAPEEMKGGEKLHEQIFNAIHVHDKLLLVLSEHSLKSEWVMTEIRRARKAEREENRRKLFPIKLVDFDAIQKWECFDADSGKDLAVEIREYFIPDFYNWKDHDSFEKAFDRLLRDLKAEDRQTTEG